MSKITSFTENSTPADADLVVMVDAPGTVPLTQKMTLKNLSVAGNQIACITNSTLQSKAQTTSFVVWDEASDTSNQIGSAFTLDAANSRIQILEDGHYRISVTFNALLQAVTEVAGVLELRYNSIQIPGSQQAHQMGDGVTNTSSMAYSFSSIYDTAGTVNQFVEIHTKNLVGTETFKATYWTMVLEKVALT